ERARTRGDGVREGHAGHRRTWPRGGEQPLAAVRYRALRARGPVAAVTVHDFAGPDLQPHALGRRDAPRVGVEYLHAEGDVGRHLDGYRAVGLDRGVAEDLEHVVARAEGGVREVDDGLVRDRDRLVQAQEARRAVGRWGGGRIGDRGDVRVGGVDAVEVVDTPYIYDADAGIHQVLVQVHARDLVEDDVRQLARRRHRHVADHDALGGRHDRLQGVLLRVEHPHAVERRRDRRVRDVEGRRVAGHDRRRRLRGVEQPALRPADQEAAGAIEQRVGGGEAPAG